MGIVLQVQIDSKRPQIKVIKQHLRALVQNFRKFGKY